jgi:hypothetical protein
VHVPGEAEAMRKGKKRQEWQAGLQGQDTTREEAKRMRALGAPPTASGAHMLLRPENTEDWAAPEEGKGGQLL